MYGYVEVNNIQILYAYIRGSVILILGEKKQDCNSFEMWFGNPVDRVESVLFGTKETEFPSPKTLFKKAHRLIRLLVVIAENTQTNAQSLAAADALKRCMDLALAAT